MYSKKQNDAIILNSQRKRGALYASLLAIFLFFILLIINNTLQHQNQEKRATEQFYELFEMQNKLIEELNSVGADLSYYSYSKLAIASLSSKDIIAQDYLTSLIFDISTLQRRYDQIRLFDKQGNEVIRVNQQTNQPSQIVANNELQNKSDRYYFKESLSLQANQIYSSQFDLNVEQGEIEFPLKPMIRFGTPIYNDKGELLGAGIINYNGKRINDILEHLNLHEGDQVSLLNQDGYYLKASQPDTEWGFMLSERSQFRFSEQHPNIWQQLQKKDSGVIKDKTGEYYFSNFFLSPSAPFNVVKKLPVTLIMHVPIAIIRDNDSAIIFGLSTALIFLTPLFIFLGWKLGFYQINQAHLYQQLEIEAKFDELTGLQNRKAINTYLQESIAVSRRRESKLALGFIDVNDLKKMNDQHGHEAGDQLIKGVARAINNIIRMTDTAGRIGGDEFLIVFPDCNQQHADEIMARIEKEFYTLGKTTTGAVWSLSFGCTELSDETDNAANMIQRADEKMYQCKMKQKMQNT